MRRLFKQNRETAVIHLFALFFHAKFYDADETDGRKMLKRWNGNLEA